MGGGVSKVLIGFIQPQILNRVLIFLNIVSFIYLITLLVHEYQLRDIDVLERLGLKLNPEYVAGQISIPSSSSLSDYQALSESNFFREPGFVAEKKVEVKKTSDQLVAYRNLKVVGLIGSDQAIIQDPATRSIHYVKVGDQVKEATVVSVQPGKVTLKIGEETVDLVF